MSQTKLIFKQKWAALMVGCLILGSCTSRPECSYPIPTAQQLEWQQLETYAFIHFGLNTFNDMEWGYGNTPSHTFNPTNMDCEQWVLTLKACGMKSWQVLPLGPTGFGNSPYQRLTNPSRRNILCVETYRKDNRT